MDNLYQDPDPNWLENVDGNRHERRKKKAQQKRKGKRMEPIKTPEEQEMEDKEREINIRLRNDGFIQKEAYCIMQYYCKNCNQSEMLWNARDGVTPFIIGCKYCGSESRHINWHGDKRVINHIPETGDRIFINMPKEVHSIFMRKRVNDFWDNPYIPKEVDQTKETLFKSLQESWEMESPFIITWG